ncbi:MAG: hypothetical protein JXB10_01305 [Pirellulales bacterium]|nr:hypothetical protein [Pirellulales bacterium]
MAPDTHQNDPPLRRNSRLRLLIPWFAVAMVGTALFEANTVQHSSKTTGYFRGWPLIIAAFLPDEEDEFDFNPADYIVDLEGMKHYAANINLVFSVTILFCTFLAMKYFFRLRKGRRQFSIQETLVFMTTCAILGSFLVTIDFWPRPPLHGNINYIYQSLHVLPILLQIPLWFGVFCTAAVLATAMIDGVRLLTTRRKRPEL